MAWLWWVLLAVVVLVLGLWLWWTAHRLDLMHHRIEVSRAALDAQLLRRSGVAVELATSRTLDPARSLLLVDAAHEARAADPDDGSPGSVRIDRRRHEAWAGDRLLPLTPIEFALLEALVTARGDLVPHADLLAAGWPEERDPDPLWVKPHLARLRGKLRDAGAAVPTPVRALGYRLIEPRPGDPTPPSR